MIDFINNKYIDVIKYGVERKLFEYCTNKVKSSLGCELSSNLYNNDPVITSGIFGKFIKKYDNKFNMHFKFTNDHQYIIDECTMIVDMCIIPVINKNDNKIIPDTFIYIAKGKAIYSDFSKMIEFSILEERINPNEVYIYIFGKESYRLMKKLNKCIMKLQNSIKNCGNLLLYTVKPLKESLLNDNKEGYDISCINLLKKDIEWLFYSFDEDKKICHHIDRYLSQKELYREKGIIYKTGILLYGKPGQGKSSLVNAIASKYQMDIISIDTANLKYIDLVSITEMINNDINKKYIVLLEDIDTLFLDRGDNVTDKEDNAIINKLLQFLDSNSSPNNVIFMANTNYLERLDEALLRDGRFDLKVEIKGLLRVDAIRFAQSFGISKEEARKIIDDFVKEFGIKPNSEMNQSKLQNYILSSIKQLYIMQSDKAV